MPRQAREPEPTSETHRGHCPGERCALLQVSHGSLALRTAGMGAGHSAVSPSVPRASRTKHTDCVLETPSPDGRLFVVPSWWKGWSQPLNGLLGRDPGLGGCGQRRSQLSGAEVGPGAVLSRHFWGHMWSMGKALKCLPVFAAIAPKSSPLPLTATFPTWPAVFCGCNTGKALQGGPAHSQ